MKLPEDPVVRELLPEFIDDWLRQIDADSAELISSRNDQDLYRMGHTLKGSCFQFSLDDIAEMGIKIMSLAKEQRFADAEAILAKVRASFIAARDYLANLQNGE